MNLIYIIIGWFVVFIVILAIFLSWRKRKIEQIIRKMKLSGETFILEPETANYRGASAKYSRIKGNGMVGLTDEKIIFIPFVGKNIIVPINEIEEVRESKRFLGQYVGKPILVLHCTEAEIGFLVKDSRRWQNAIKGVIE